MDKKMMPLMLIMLIVVVVGLVFAWQGVSMHREAAVEEASFNSLQQSYWTESKATRDAAEANSDLAQDLATLKQYPSQLLFLKLVGVGKILTGIFALLFAILMALVMMPVRLGELIKTNR